MIFALKPQVVIVQLLRELNPSLLRGLRILSFLQEISHLLMYVDFASFDVPPENQLTRVLRVDLQQTALSRIPRHR
jgi:hypothetical protein